MQLRPASPPRPPSAWIAMTPAPMRACPATAATPKNATTIPSRSTRLAPGGTVLRHHLASGTGRTCRSGRAAGHAPAARPPLIAPTRIAFRPGAYLPSGALF
jgi:hypothetical protein